MENVWFISVVGTKLIQNGFLTINLCFIYIYELNIYICLDINFISVQLFPSSYNFFLLKLFNFNSCCLANTIIIA